MIHRILLLLIILQNFCFAQLDTNIEKRYYSTGKLKFSIIKRGIDTVEFKRYYKNGQIEDSLWLYIQGRQETPLGVEKRYYKDGKLSSVTYYHKGDDEYTLFGYWQNGKLERFVQRPTGLTKFYNKNGEQMRQYDYHKLKDIYVSQEFRNGRHLERYGYKNRIQTKIAFLTQPENKIKINSDVLISLTCNSDTNILTHCQIEGFSKDSVYLSKFHYNENYYRGSNVDILKYDSTFSLGFNQLNTILYAKHNNRKRSFGVITSLCLGVDLLLVSIIVAPSIPFAVKASIPSLTMIYGGAFIVGVPLVYLGKYLYKSMVPKKYVIRNYKLLLGT